MLLDIIIVAAILGIIAYVAQAFIPAPAGRYIQVAVGVVFAIYLIWLLAGGLGAHPPARLIR
jgi:hypothetical protein